jgi:hypothetical protein
MQEVHGLMEIGERLMWLQSLAVFSFLRDLLFADVVAVDPRIFLSRIHGLEKDVLIVFTSHHSDTPGHVLCLGLGLF